MQVPLKKPKMSDFQYPWGGGSKNGSPEDTKTPPVFFFRRSNQELLPYVRKGPWWAKVHSIMKDRIQSILYKIHIKPIHIKPICNKRLVKLLKIQKDSLFFGKQNFPWCHYLNIFSFLTRTCTELGQYIFHWYSCHIDSSCTWTIHQNFSYLQEKSLERQTLPLWPQDKTALFDPLTFITETFITKICSPDCNFIQLNCEIEKSTVGIPFYNVFFSTISHLHEDI